MIMTPQQIQQAIEWLTAHKAEITRIRPRLAGSIVRYIPRKGWGTGLDGHINGAPSMWAQLDAQDPMDAAFRSLGIPVDQPL